MFDTLQAVFWSITYILIIIAGFKSASYKKLVSMPYFALFGNFAWEFNALLLSRGNNLTHNTWFA